MCGICGLVMAHRDHPVDREDLIAMRDRMVHRGPDDEGLHLDGNVGLGFRRLSIVDLASGHQPISNEHDDIWTVFNGEIYNHRELRDELIAKGHKYKSESDTETIVHLYEEWGIAGLERLNGMFGIAIWDSRKRKMILVRDRLGIKPLYYSLSSEGLAFASEIKAIVGRPKAESALNHNALEEYLIFRFVAGEETMFKGVKNLLPGHIMICEDNKTKISKFWDIPSPDYSGFVNEAKAFGELDNLLADSVEKRLMSDVPLGTFCSGGVDSSLITAYAADFKSDLLNTYSIGFNEAEWDESDFAQMVANKFNTTHHLLQVSNREFADSMPKLLWHNDEPLNHANSVLIYHISKLAKEKVTVVLTGEGADELFGGYPRYLIAKWCQALKYLPGPARKLLGSMASVVPHRKLRKLSGFIPLSDAENIVLNSSFSDWKMPLSLLNQNCNFNRVIDQRMSLIGESSRPHDSLVEKLTHLDLRTYLVSILNRQDKMSMAASLESRVPFLDHRLVEFARRLPANLKLNRMQTKAIVKRLGEKKLPREVVHRAKSGFGVPVSDWLRDEKGIGRFLEMFSEPRFKQRGFLKTDIVLRLREEHLSRQTDHGDILWELINLELWYRTFCEGEQTFSA